MMRDVSDQVEVVCPLPSSWQAFDPSPLAVFDERVIAFIQALAEQLISQADTWPNLAALGFFLRPKALEQAVHTAQSDQPSRMPLGLTFHLVPSNVPTVAPFSWLAALLQGNSAIVRLASRAYPEQDRLLSLLNNLLAQPQWQAIANRTRFIRYPHNDAVTHHFSTLCQMRIVWGGDTTITAIRQIPLPAGAMECCFPDRQSLALIDTSYLAKTTASRFDSLVRQLAQDIGQFNQQACASPVLIVWLGHPATALWQRFWSRLAAHYPQESVHKLEQLLNYQLAACDGTAGEIEAIGPLTIAALHQSAALKQCRFGGGWLVYQIVDSLTEWLAQPGSFQTCVYLGADPNTLRQRLTQTPSLRIDRVVQPGHALDFDWHWDGRALLQAFSRVMI